MSIADGHQSSGKAIRLIEYLLRIASLRSRPIREITEYEKVLWLSNVPRQRGCFTQAWGPDQDHEPDEWLEVQNRREPELPSVPAQCADWINASSLRSKSAPPELPPEITRHIRNPAWHEGSEHPETVPHTARLEEHPDITIAWNRYVSDHWLPWTVDHDAQESIHEIYSALFAVYQEQLRLGEEYELVLGLGLLTWQTPTGQRIRRHLIAADATLEFESRLAKFTVRPHTDGAKLRPELDMLDIEEQPARAEETAKTALSEAEDDPWERGRVEGVLQALVHSINSQGEYHGSLDTQNVRASAKPVVEYAPALILRKRSAKCLTDTLKRIKERIEQGEVIPSEFADLAEITSTAPDPFDNEPVEMNSTFSGEVFFPKPSNEEQRRIVEKLRTSSGVLVQGPPGTGKSHTIANLICHLLATGQRILVTAKTPRALQVLMGKPGGKDKLVHEEILPLCISLLGSGMEEKRSLESSVDGILRKRDDWNESRVREECAELEGRLQRLREEAAEIDRRLRNIRESETYSHSIADGTYRGTAARIAEAVNHDRPAFEWMTDAIPWDRPWPHLENELPTLLFGLRNLTPEKREELALLWPTSLPNIEILDEEGSIEWPDTTPDEFARLVESERRAIEDETRRATGADEWLAEQLSESSPAILQAICAVLSGLQDTKRRLMASTYTWARNAIADVFGGNSSLWRERACATQIVIKSIEALVAVADDTALELASGASIKALFEDATTLKEHIRNGGTLGWGPFRPKLVRKRLQALKTVRINGRFCSTAEQFSILSDVLHVSIQCEKAWGLWVGRSEKVQGPYTLQIAELRSLCDRLDSILSLESLIEKGREVLRHCPEIIEPIWSDESHLDRLLATSYLAQARQCKRLAQEELQFIETPIWAISSMSNSHPVTKELLQAFCERNVDRFAHARNKMQDLERERRKAQKADEDLLKLKNLLPDLARALQENPGDACWDERVPQTEHAWHWAQARNWIEEYIRQEDAPALARRARQIEDEINAAIAKIASLHAWTFCFSRLNDEHCRNMVAWQQNFRKITKSGIGKQDFFHRKEAQKNLDLCREAIPAWVMPLHRVWDTVKPEPGMFDVIIVDEASQCGPEAVPLFYMAKKIIIVGDEKQISPEAEGVSLDAVTQLINQFLFDFKHKASFNVNRSLFGQGELRYSSSQVVLREHFRCMPEIIRFSNDLCYSDTPLIPLRQYGKNRLTPLEHVFVAGGYREGSNSRAINRPEAEAIVTRIVAMCGDKCYDGKSIGVIILQGDAQAELIEKQLLEKLGAEEFERRRLICGKPYSFQGDERDVILLSLVAAPNERIGPLVKPADERRFNVAASRARDQMILFHSVTCDDLSASCLRRRLLEFFENTRHQEIAGLEKEEIERRATQDNRRVVKPPTPFDSWFEVDVALEIARKGFEVLPQYKFAGKFIDLVVQDGPRKLAVECDGDHWHGPEKDEEDTYRQRQLERCQWEFCRVRESVFYANKVAALEGLWRALEARDIFPVSLRPTSSPEVGVADVICRESNTDATFREDYSDDDDNDDGGGGSRLSNYEEPLLPGLDGDTTPFGRRTEDLTPKEIEDAILQALAKCPNQTCTLHSLTSRVLKEVGVLTRGNPRIEFEKRVLRSLVRLEKRESVEQYRAKNKRVRLI